MGDWHSWLFLGGRGAGKTRAGAEWLAALAGRGVRCALIGASLHDVREVMIEGPSGLKSIAKKGNRPSYEVSRKRLRWPDGGVRARGHGDLSSEHEAHRSFFGP